MSIKYNDKTIAGNYKVSASTTASDTKAGPIKIATEQELKDTTNNKVAVTPYLLNKALNSINRGLKIGRIGIGFINESQQQERYLNGQVIIQDQFESFTTWVKDLIKLYPNLSCTNEEFETACSMSAYGQCGKFVVDNNAGSIRLPKVVNVQGLFDLTQAGVTVEAGLPPHTHTRGTQNITGTFFIGKAGQTGNGYGATGAFYYKGNANNAGNSAQTGGSTPEFAFDASRSWTGSTSDPNYTNDIKTTNTVQPEAIQYPYYIQVATGSETEVDITNEIELNNPFFFGMSQYFEVEPNNISWLKSNGQWNSKAVYTDYYDWILTNVNNNKKGFVTNKMYGYAENNGAIFMLTTPTPQIGQPVYGYGTNIYLGVVEALVENGFVSTYFETQGQSYRTATVYRNSQYDQTGIIDDYHWCIDTVNETFRLPIKVNLASGKAVVGNGMSLGLTNGSVNVGISASNWTENGQMFTKNAYGKPVSGTMVNSERTEGVIGVTTDPAKSGIETSDSGLHLYFYVGETVQNANLINAGRIEEKVASLIPDNSSLIASYGMPSNKYINLTLGASNSSYTAPANGWFFINLAGGSSQYARFQNSENGMAYQYGNNNTNTCSGCIEVKKGDVISVQYNATSSTVTFRFIYAQGSESEAQ